MTEMCCTERVKLITFADSPYEVEDRDGLILADCADGAIEVRLPDAETHKGRSWKVKKVDGSANAATVVTNEDDQEVDGEGDGFVLSAQWQAAMFESDGSDYVVTADYNPEQSLFRRITVSGINGKSATSGAAFTADRDYDLAFARVRASASNGITVGATVALEIAAGSGDIVPETYLEGLIETGKIVNLTPDLLHRVLAEGNVLRWRVSVAAVGTSQTLVIEIVLLKL